MTKPCIIVDVDGTLTDVGHRLHHIRKTPPDWQSFFDACSDDPPNDHVLWLLDQITLATSISIFLCSGRPESHRSHTVAWMSDNGVVYDYLLMRRTGDFRPDVVVKKEMLDGIRGQGFEPILAIDDRPSVVRMWRENGVPCLAADDSDWVGDQHHYAGDVEGRTLLTVMVGPTQAGKTVLLEDLPRGGIVFRILRTYGTRTGASMTDWYFHPEHVVSSDQVRRDLHDGEYVYDPAENARVFAAVHRIARTRMEAGLPVVVDATNLRKKDRLAIVDLAPRGTRVRYVVVDRDLDVKLDQRRPEISEEVVRRQDQMFRSQSKDIISGDGLPNIEVLDLRKYR